MTEALQKEIIKKLFELYSDLFFNKLNAHSAKEIQSEESPFFIKQQGWDKEKQKVQIIPTYALKDEIKDLLAELTLTEILQILKINDNHDVKTIKNWVKFFGIILIIQIIVGIIIAIITLS